MATHRYRNRDITGEEILFIRQLIQDHPELSRWKLSRELCEAWQWKQANGALRDMVCRGLLLMLHRAGEIELPPVKRVVRNRIAERQKPEPVIPDNRPMRGPLHSITPLEFVQVRRTPEEALFNSLVEQYHYLGYEQPIGEHLKYLVKANGQVIACAGLAKRAASPESARPLPRMERRSAPAQRALAGLQHAVSDSAVGSCGTSGFAPSGAHGQACSARLATDLRASYLLVGDVRRYLAFSRHVLSRGQLASDRHDAGPRASRAYV